LLELAPKLLLAQGLRARGGPLVAQLPLAVGGFLHALEVAVVQQARLARIAR